MFDSGPIVVSVLMFATIYTTKSSFYFKSLIYYLFLFVIAGRVKAERDYLPFISGIG
jgi:hypothetical protein